MKTELTKKELYQTLSAGVLEVIRGDLKATIATLNARTQAEMIHKVSNEIFTIEAVLKTR